MKIIYAPNPLQTTIELNDHDKEILRLKVILQAFKSHVTIARLYLKEGTHFDRTKAYAELHPANFKERLTARGTKQIKEFTKELLGSHAGDCICVPTSCEKCHAESMLGINTIEGLSKQEAGMIDAMFRFGMTLDEVIAYLADYHPKTVVSPNFTQEMIDFWTPKWKEQALRAATWLKTYKEEHFPTPDITVSKYKVSSTPKGNVG